MKRYDITKPIGLATPCKEIESTCSNAHMYKRCGLRPKHYIIPLDSGSGRTTLVEYMTDKYKEAGVLSFTSGLDDYIEIAHIFGSRVANEAELFKEQVEKLDIPITLITEADCIPDHYSKDINGKIIAINPAILKPEYQRADRQLYYVTGGFGASANSRGSAVFCTNLHTGKSTRYERMDVMGEVKPERLPEWAKEKAQELSNKKRNKDKER